MKKTLTILEHLQSAIGFVNFAALILVVSMQVLSRFIIQKPLLWSEEAARFLLFWLVMNGAALAVLKNRHFTTELFNIEKVENPIGKTILIMIPTVCTLIVGMIMVIYGIAYTKIGAYRTMPISQINMMYVYLAIPLSGVLIVLYSLFQIFSTGRLIRKK